MHEYSIAQALLEQVEAEAARRGATAVHRVHVRLGALSGVEASLLATAFEVARRATLCADAELTIDPVAADWRCPRCHQAVAEGFLRCESCGVPAALVAGDEIILARLEMEVPSHV
jgi:hydrogenase nickel incorporation protein HypA/HybF